MGLGGRLDATRASPNAIRPPGGHPGAENGKGRFGDASGRRGRRRRERQIGRRGNRTLEQASGKPSDDPRPVLTMRMLGFTLEECAEAMGSSTTIVFNGWATWGTTWPTGQD